MSISASDLSSTLDGTALPYKVRSSEHRCCCIYNQSAQEEQEQDDYYPEGLNSLLGIVGGRRSNFPTTEDLRKAGLDGVKFRNDLFVIHLIQPADTMTMEQFTAVCENDPGKKAALDKLVNLASTELLEKKRSAEEVHGHVMIVCKAKYRKDRIFHIANAIVFGRLVIAGGANGVTFPRTSVKSGECRGKHYPAFSAFIVNATTGEVLTEDECALVSMKRQENIKKKCRK